MSFIASCFGYILNFIYSFINNYGLAVILFSIIIKLALLPISIKQQKTMQKSTKVQAKMQELQNKYKNNPEKLNQEILDLYKNEKMNPFSGCLSSIIQLVLLLAVFYLIRSPLTFMKKVDPQVISTYTQEIQQNNNNRNVYPEIAIIREKGQEDERVNINMNFLGIDLSSIPGVNNKDFSVYIIPVLYVISTFISTRITSSMQKKNNQKKDNLIEGNVDKEKAEQMKEEISPEESMMEANKMMTWMMPIMSISIAIIAPLGMSLYWLVSNILMILERLILNKISKSKEEEENA